jgi:YD repeat-containing protein
MIPGNLSWWEGYDALGRVVTQTNTANQRSSKVYDAVGNVVVEQYVSGSEWVTYSYDGNQQMLTMRDRTGITTHTYSVLGALSQQVPSGNYTLSYGYDGVGNRTLLIDPDGGKRQTAQEVGADVTTFVWDGEDYLMEKTP